MFKVAVKAKINLVNGVAKNSVLMITKQKGIRTMANSTMLLYGGRMARSWYKGVITWEWVEITAFSDGKNDAVYDINIMRQNALVGDNTRGCEEPDRIWKHRHHICMATAWEIAREMEASIDWSEKSVK